MSEARNRETEDSIEYFLEDITFQGRSDRTREAYKRVLRDFEEYLDTRDLSVAEANHRDCMAYVHRLRGESAESTVATYASYLNRFYDYMMRVETFDQNPMSIVVEEMDESINTDPARRDISVWEMRKFVESVGHPLDRAVILTLLKTGIRAGELCNLDMRDIYLEDTGSKPGLNGVAYEEHRPRLDGRADSLFVDDSPTAGSIYNDQRRTASNKRKRATTIPIDDELKEALVEWLAIRPDPISESNPLFLSTTDHWGQRMTPDMVHHLVERHARDASWYREGGGPEENVTPHYFRHFFTTHLRDRTGDRGIVKYLRGDVASDIIDTYTHDWGDRVREVYLTHIYEIDP